MDYLVQLLVTGIMFGSIYAMIALGFALVYKCTGVVNFAQGAFVGLGAYLMYLFSAQLGLPVWLGFLLCTASGILIGLLVHFLVFRFMVGQPILAMVIASLGLAVIIQGVITLFWPVAGMPLPQFISPRSISLANVSVSMQSLAILGAALLLFVAVNAYVRFSKMGLAMRAVAESHKVAQSVGVPVNRIFSSTWALSTLLGIIGGIFLGLAFGVNPWLISLGLKAIPVWILAGLESIDGVLIAGLIIGLAEAMSVGYIDPIVGGGFGEVGSYILLLLVLIFLPYGLFGLKKIERM